MSSGSEHRSLRFEAWRLNLIYIVVGLTLTFFIVRLVNLQLFDVDLYQTRAEDNYTNEVSIPAPRGIIYDRNGYILARNIAAYNVVVTPANLPADNSDIQRIYRELSDLIDVPAGSFVTEDAPTDGLILGVPGGLMTEESLEEAKLFAACVEGPSIAQLVALQDTLAPFSSVKVKCNVSEETARIVEEKKVDWPGVSVEVEAIRDYPTGELTSHLIGFLGPIPASQEEEYRAKGFVLNRDKVGYAGVETALEEILAGRNGLRVVQVDVAGQEIRNLEPPIAPEPGHNVYLTIDTRLQAAADATLREEIDFWNTYFGKVRISSGVIIAMNPKTGEILAMVSYPSYENNRFARLIPAYYYDQLSQDPRKPLLNNAISAEYPPGSTFKLSTATGSFNEGVVGPTDIIQAPGQLLLCERFNPNDPCTDSNTRPFVDHIFEKRPEGFGPISFFQCIAFSSNVCFYKLGGGFEDEIPQGLGIERLEQYARALGYDARSGIELPGEQDGLIPDPQWKRINTGENWSTGDTYIASVGQGYVLATPLQVLMSGSVVANGGKLMQPTIVRQVTDGDGNVVDMWFDSDPEDFKASEFQSEGSYQISPFTPNLKWDSTVTPLIQEYSCDEGYCALTDQLKTIKPETFQAVREGTRLAVTASLFGTLNDLFADFPIAVAGKTGTAEYCDDVARAAQRCQFGSWPTHAWTMAYAPYEDPEIIVLAFAYNGGEGASVAGPMVQRVLKAYFEIKAIDIAQGGNVPVP
ncbi:MAG TPA: penicillin-binding transpeptidase domain-containing protein [Anaerolineales bacterium]|nr:penicillin-binding transpeptidase domain-containing protein [Anaerolineales bacterium]HNA89630.1 penicillin-binding transpeptidase domain-containing protein [Anaerolineales bacterium]HNB36676.1 penicillin-binding transpeptidase domain-containing protein [Anaerolineales bacterium]